MKREHLAWVRAQPATARCAFCPKWKASGTVEEVKALSDAHRADAHPELAKYRRKRKIRANTAVIAFRQSLTEAEAEEIEETRRKRMQLLGQNEDPP